MLIIFGSSVVFLACVAAWLGLRRHHDLAWMAPTAAGIVLGSALIVLLSSQVTQQTNIQRFYAAQNTLQAARQSQNISALELAAIQQKVVECNQWLAEVQFWAQNPATNWFYPRQGLRLREIR